MPALRIAYLVSRYPAISHTFILREVIGLRQYGIDIQVASINPCDRPSGLLTEQEKSESARTFYVKSAGISGVVRTQWRTFVSTPRSYLRSLFFALALGGADVRRIALSFFYFVEAVLIGDWMRAGGLHHLHVHFATPAATVGMILTKLAPITMSMTVHGPDEFYEVGAYYLTQKIETCKFVCAIGQFARSQLMKVSRVSEWHKLLISPLGVDTEQFPPRPLFLPPGTFEILCIGRLTDAKGQHVLLEATALLRSHGRAVRVRFVGDGPDRRSLEQQSSNLGLASDVTFEGAVNQDHIRAFYERAGVFALASFAEGIPIVLMEAMSMEVPCVSTWITGIPELIRNGIDGLLVAPGDAEALASAIAELMDDAELRRSLGVAGRLRVKDKFDLTRNLARLAGIFHQQLEANA